MKKVYLLLLFISITAFSQRKTETINSIPLGETRTITVELPASYETNKTRKYPVLYLFDGEYLLDPFSGALKYGAYWDDLPETIIVAIHQNKNDEREDDSTFDGINGLPFEKGAKFFEFVAGEVIPKVEKNYRTAPFRIIAGHGVTAGYLNFFLYKEVPLFNAYISMSPELATQMEVRVPEKFAKLKTPLFYYLSAADGDVKKTKEPIQKLDQNIKIANNPLINYKYDLFKNTTYYSAVLYAIPNALNQIFEAYKPINLTEYNDKIVILKSGYVDYLREKYDIITKTLGVEMPVRMNDYIAVETAILKNNAFDELGILAEIANTSYPKAMLGEYELGLMYEKMGDAKRASKKYQNASQMEPIGRLNKDLMYDKIDEMNDLIKKK